MVTYLNVKMENCSNMTTIVIMGTGIHVCFKFYCACVVGFGHMPHDFGTRYMVSVLAW